MKLSVVVPCFPPHIKFLESCITDLKKQTYSNFEIIIALSETSNDIALQLENKLQSILPIKILATLDKQYAGQNRNRGGKYASGDIICFIDVDDFTHPQKLEFVNYVFEKYNPKMFLHAYLWKNQNFTIVEEFDNIILESSQKIFDQTFGIPSTRDYIKEALPETNICLKLDNYEFHHGHVSIHKSVLDSITYNDRLSGQDSIFCRDVLWSFNNTLYSPLKLVSFMFDKKNYIRKLKHYKL